MTCFTRHHSFTCNQTVIPVFTPQPHSITSLWLVLISHPVERSRLSWPRWWLHPKIYYLPKMVTYLINNQALSWTVFSMIDVANRYPGERAYNDVCRELVTKYAFLADRQSVNGSNFVSTYSCLVLLHCVPLATLGAWGAGTAAIAQKCFWGNMSGKSELIWHLVYIWQTYK